LKGKKDDNNGHTIMFDYLSISLRHND